MAIGKNNAYPHKDPKGERPISKAVFKRELHFRDTSLNDEHPPSLVVLAAWKRGKRKTIGRKKKAANS